MSTNALYVIRGFLLPVLFLLVHSNGALAAAEYVPGEILVKFRDTSPSRATSINSIHSYVGSFKKKAFSKLKIHHMQLPHGLSVEEAVQLYQQDPNVEYAEPNYIVHATQTFPDDTSFNELWGLHNTGQSGGTADADIDAPEAWDLTTGASDVVVAVIDTGVAYDHPDLADNIWINTGETDCNDGIDNEGNGYIDDCNGWDFLDNDNDPMDFTDHGTHVAGTIAAIGDNGTGITGVMWEAKIMPLRFLGIDGTGFTTDAIKAILYADANGAHVINNSWGGGYFSQALKDAIDDSSATIVSAAGNGGSDGIGDNNDSSPFYPASYTSANIIAVAATDHTDTLAGFSNYGVTSVDVADPGVSIYSTIPAREIIFSDDFNDNDLSNPAWTTGGTHNFWAVNNEFGRISMTDRPFANYLNSTNTWSESPAFSLSGKTGCKVSYRMRLSTLSNDFLRIEASLNQSSWTSLASYSGTTNGSFTLFAEDLSNYEGQATVYIRFRLETDGSGTSAGVSIDDVEVSCYDATYSGSEYEYNQGTSMAAPHVSGVAGLVRARNHSLANYQVKALLLNNVDPRVSLATKVLTGGRLNAFGAVSNALNSQTPTSLTVAGVSNTKIDLLWTDNSSNESGFKIERKTDENGEFTELASVSGNTTAYSDSNITHSTTYYYRVRAFGGSLGRFEHSNEVSATTPTPVSAGGDGGGGGGGGGCFIATAAYGSPLHPHVKELRRFRDRHLLNSPAGKGFVSLYYRYAPSLAEGIQENDNLRFAARIMLTPLVMMVIYPYQTLSVMTAFLIGSLWIFRRKSN